MILFQEDQFGQAKRKLAELKKNHQAEVATFAGGCFWCLEAPFEHEPGVLGVVAGYMGGRRPNPTYAQVCTGVTGHREIVQVWFDPNIISYQRLLDIFWLQIDPTDPGGQFTDRGEEYQTAIFTHTNEQAMLAEESKEKLALSGTFSEPIATEIINESTFYPAEDYHQQYYLQKPTRYQQYNQGSGRAGYIKQHPLKKNT